MSIVCLFLPAGVPVTGAATLDPRTSSASLTVRASNDPHGVFSFASSSIDTEVSEGDSNTPYLLIDRKFGSIGGFQCPVPDCHWIAANSRLMFRSGQSSL